MEPSSQRLATLRAWASTPLGPITRPGKEAGRCQAAFLVHDISRMRRTLFDHRLRPLKLTRSRWWVLAHLARHESQSLSQATLARMLGVGKANLGGLIEGLEQAGYVSRYGVKEDRRTKMLSVTPAGCQALITVESIGHHLNQAIADGVNENDLHAFERVVVAMKGNLKILVQPD